MIENKVHVGQSLKALVKSKGITQTSLAEMLGVTQGSVWQYFEASSPAYDTIVRICAACDVPTWHFIASIETGIPTLFFEAMDSIMSLDQASREYVLRRLAEEVEFICGLTEQ